MTTSAHTQTTAPDDPLTRKLQEVGFPTLGHFLEEGFVDPRIHALVPDVKIVGRAVTLRIVPPDATPMAEALDLLGPGDVLVVDTGQNATHAPIGAVTGCAARVAGAAGVVVDGVVTDLRELREMRLPVFARGTSLLTTKRLGRGDGGVGRTVSCGGAVVRPGDLVLADDNGVLVISPRIAADVLARALASDRAEPALLARLRAGESPLTVLSD
ncbi:RraA family protein [Streptomyces sp. NEAU-YJ-81]|uniref:RraA family protein n=1 Tax=Streptomyces sp. NEAU-YJ-81 TaxID=2820288 RepID=UPI001ABD1A58|nr:RraA family protein [Streptomyces sp. NEAU-YJ-81]MBO3681373.1 RraA family protein [Streptomyces sp. NEAU-YJ-81]